MFEVGQLGKLQTFSLHLQEVKARTESTSVFSPKLVGCGRVFEAHQCIAKKLAKLTKFPVS